MAEDGRRWPRSGLLKREGILKTEIGRLARLRLTMMTEATANTVANPTMAMERGRARDAPATCDSPLPCQRLELLLDNRLQLNLFKRDLFLSEILI
jgi:hypothetical protein